MASHIVQNEYINEQEVQCDLAILCLRYLCLLTRSNGYEPGDRQEKAKLGWFAFQDYACSQWHIHIDTIIERCWDLFNDPSRGPTYETKFGSALVTFLVTHRPDLTREQHQDLKPPPQVLKRFSGFSFYNALGVLWNHIYTHQKSEYDKRDTVALAQLEKALLSNRLVLEKLKPDDKACIGDKIEDYYGRNLFKCKRVLCKFFHQGYERQKDRENHDSRHERPFQCPVNCSLAPIGFSAKKDRDRHVRKWHPEQTEGTSVFEPLPSHSGTSDRRFKCNICQKEFTRKITLKGHQRSHFGERPYPCPLCGKAFARLSDCQRHEKKSCKGSRGQ